jgi:hypothetical protein
MEAGPDLQQRLHLTGHFEPTRCRADHIGDQFEERALARAVAPDDRHLLAAPDLQVDAVEGGVLGVRARFGAEQTNMSRKRYDGFEYSRYTFRRSDARMTTWLTAGGYA